MKEEVKDRMKSTRINFSFDKNQWRETVKEKKHESRGQVCVGKKPEGFSVSG